MLIYVDDHEIKIPCEPYLYMKYKCKYYGTQICGKDQCANWINKDNYMCSSID